MENIFFFWLVVGLVFLMIEMASPGLFMFLSVAVAAFAVAGVSLFFSITAQAIIFLVWSGLAFVILGMRLRKQRYTAHYQSNMYSLIGERAQVIATTTQREGKVKVDGMVWTARAQHDVQYKEGQLVEIVSVVGCHLIVKHTELTK